MKKYLKKVLMIFLIVFAVIGIQNKLEVNAAVGSIYDKPEKGWTRYEVDNLNIEYSEGWTNMSSYNNECVYAYSTDEIHTIKFNFIGRKIRILACSSTNSSFANINIDGEDYGVYNNACNSNYEIRNRVLFEDENLYWGNHSVVISTVKSESDAREDLKWMNLDAIDLDEGRELKPYVEWKPGTIKDMELEESEVSIEAGKTKDLVAKIIPEDATNKKLKWKSSDESVATVDENGRVTAIKEGLIYISATTTDGSGLVSYCDVRVTPRTYRVSSLELNKTESTIKVGESDSLDVTINPWNAINKNVKWTSSDENVATVDENGKVTALKEGTAEVIVTTEDGNVSAKCIVTVINGKERAILTIYMSNGDVNKYDLSKNELKDFLEWYDARSMGEGRAYFVLERMPVDNGYTSKDYIPFNEIRYFNVMEPKENNN